MAVHDGVFTVYESSYEPYMSHRNTVSIYRRAVCRTTLLRYEYGHSTLYGTLYEYDLGGPYLRVCTAVALQLATRTKPVLLYWLPHAASTNSSACRPRAVPDKLLECCMTFVIHHPLLSRGMTHALVVSWPPSVASSQLPRLCEAWRFATSVRYLCGHTTIETEHRLSDPTSRTV